MTRLVLQKRIDPDRTITVVGDELHYLTRVRRHKVQDTVTIVDPDGQTFDARITHIEKQRAHLCVADKAESPRLFSVPPIILMVALPKGSLMDDVVRKLNEIGVMTLIPFRAERTNNRPISSAKEARWHRIALESTRQCGRQRPLNIHPDCSFSDLSNYLRENDVRLMLHPTAEKTLPEALPKTGDVTLLIGPEGGFTDKEISIARAAGFVSVKLNMPILRIETAAIAAGVLAVALRRE